MHSFIAFVLSHAGEILSLTYEHTKLTLLAVFIAIAIGIPLGILIASVKGTDKPILGFANIMQAVPSLAALGLLVPILGIGSPPAILMVVLYSLLPILKNTYTGLKNINEQMIEAAYGIGMKPSQVLFRVKLPLALPVIMSGVRVASVTAVGLMTIAAYIGAGGLGNYVIAGIQTSNTNLMLSGALPACILALLMDFVMSKVEKAVVPISLSLSTSQLTRERIGKERRHKKITLALVGVLLCVLILAAFVPSVLGGKDRIVVGSKPEVEGQLMGHIVADVIESHTDLKVERKLGLGATKIVYGAIKSGEIDVYPEYSGSAYSAIYGITPKPGMTGEELIATIRPMMKEDDLIFTEVYGFNDRYTLGVTKEFAEAHQVKTISDLEKLGIPLTLATDQEFSHRADGIPALKDRYPALSFEKTLQFQGALMYEALISGDVNVMTPFSTDALIEKYDVRILEDDREALSHYHMASVIREDTAEEHPEVLEALAVLDHEISNEEMMAMNYEVVVKGRDIAEVAHEFLEQKHLLK